MVVALRQPFFCCGSSSVAKLEVEESLFITSNKCLLDCGSHFIALFVYQVAAQIVLCCDREQIYWYKAICNNIKLR